MATRAWQAPPFNVYAATETGGIAAECDQHHDMHLFKDLVIPRSSTTTTDQSPMGNLEIDCDGGRTGGEQRQVPRGLQGEPTDESPLDARSGVVDRAALAGLRSP